MEPENSESAGGPAVGPQTEQLNLNLNNPVQANLYGSAESRRAVRSLEEVLLGSLRSLKRREAAHEAGISLLSARKIWRAQGIPNLTDDDVYFTDQDVQALRRVTEMVAQHKITEEAALSLTRSIGQTTDRMVVWQIEALVEDMVVNDGLTDADARRRLVHLLPELLDSLEDLLVLMWRRQMNEAVQRLATRVERPDGSTETYVPASRVPVGAADLPLARGVGFADLVSFTSLSRQMNERTLANLVQRFEQRCAEVIAMGGGRLIKTIGDEVMFMAETPDKGAEISLALAAAIREDEELPQARVAFVWGRVLPRLGDLYGPTVNLASRLVALAEPGTVLVDASTAGVISGDERFILIPQQTRGVRGFGDVQPVTLLHGKGPGLEIDLE